VAEQNHVKVVGRLGGCEYVLLGIEADDFVAGAFKNKLSQLQKFPVGADGENFHG